MAFAAYIIVGKMVSQRVEGLGGLAVALVIAAVIQTPLGVAFARPGLADMAVLATLALAGVMATLIPFSLEAIALRTLPMATFGLLLAFEPAVAALAGVVIRGESLSVQQLAGHRAHHRGGGRSLGPRGWMRRFGPYARGMADDEGARAVACPAVLRRSPRRGRGTARPCTQERHAEVGAVLTREGEEGDEFFVIGAGVVAITAEDRQLRQLGPGDYLGEIALVFGGARTATATVSEPATLFVLGKVDFLALLQEQPRIEDKILATVSERMRYR